MKADARQKFRVRVASQVHAEAVAIIALREVCRSIGDHEKPEAIRQRIKDLIAVKAEGIGVDEGNFNEVVERAHEVVQAADDALADVIKKAKNHG